MLCLQHVVIVVNSPAGLAVELNKSIEYSMVQCISICRIGTTDLVNVSRDFNQVIQMHSAEVQHVPLHRQLADIRAEVVSQARIKNDIIFKDKYAGLTSVAGFANDLQMTEQASIGARCT